MSRSVAAITSMVVLAACASEAQQPKSRRQGSDVTVSPQSERAQGFAAEDHTPGFFRDMYRVQQAQAVVDDATAVERLLVELSLRLSATRELPPMTEVETQTLDGLLVLALRSVQAAANDAGAARHVGDELVGRVLGLDPALRAWNDLHPDDPMPVTAEGVAAFAEAALTALRAAAGAQGQLCAQPPHAATFDPGYPEQNWVPEYCYPDTYVPGYCRPDTYVDGECDDRWVPESCSGGYWRDDGYYDYRCYGDGFCEDVWVEMWTYIGGDCSGGYYETTCYDGYWERGLCYDGYTIAGTCIPAHWEHRYPYGTWTYSDITPPAACSEVRPAQHAIAQSGVEVIAAKAESELAPEWRSAVDDLLSSGALETPSDATFDAARQIFEAAAP